MAAPWQWGAIMLIIRRDIKRFEFIDRILGGYLIRPSGKYTGFKLLTCHYR